MTSSNKQRDSIQVLNWSGSIPVVLTLAPTSLSSPTLPPPIHILLSRQTYLHVGLRSAVERLHKFAPTTLSFSSEKFIQNEPDPGSYSDNPGDHETSKTTTAPSSSSTATSTEGKNHNNPAGADTNYPVCWFEDEDTQMALRWHLFAGVLYDLKQSPRDLPWKLRLHFTAYPNSQILPLEKRQVLVQVQHFFKNSLKQALCSQYGSSKAAMNLTKNSHQRLWESVLTANYSLYEQVNDNENLQQQQQPSTSKTGGLSLIPVRVYVNSRPPIQRKCQYETTRTLGSILAEWLPDYFQSVESASMSNDDNHDNNNDKSGTTVTNNAASTIIQPAENVIWRVCGIQPSLGTSLVDLWTNLCHPDHFLYIIVLTDS